MALDAGDHPVVTGHLGVPPSGGGVVTEGLHVSQLVLEGRPAARATILERPPVDAVARRLLAAAGYAQRVTVVSGDMFVAVPEGHDLHLLSHTLHDWGGHDVRRLVERCFDALAPGGWLVDHDAYVNRDKTEPLPVARYSVLLMHTTAGKCWSVAELETILEDVGFGVVEERPAGLDRSVVVARAVSAGERRSLAHGSYARRAPATQSVRLLPQDGRRRPARSGSSVRPGHVRGGSAVTGAGTREPHPR